MEQEHTQTESTQTPTEEQSAPKGSKQPLIWGGVIVIVIIIGIIALIANNNGVGENLDEELAMVSGQQITVRDLQPLENQRRGEYEMQGMEVPAEDARMIRQDALASKIRQVVLMQYAESEGITIDEDQVEMEFQQILVQFDNDEEAMRDALNESGLTPEDIKQSIREGLLLETVAHQIGDINVTDAEVREQYDMISQQNPQGLPPFEEIQDVLRQNIEQEQVVSVLIELFNELYTEVEIEIHDGELDEGVRNILGPTASEQQQIPAPTL